MVQKAAVLIPRTENGEVLVVRRNFWDYEREQQMTYAGRWCLVSGMQDPGDTSTEHTALRECGEEAGDIGTITDVMLFTGTIAGSYDIMFLIDFYECRVADPTTPTDFSLEHEVIDAKWVPIPDALRLLQTQLSTETLLEQFRIRDPNTDRHKRFGNPAPRMPRSHYDVLQMIQEYANPHGLTFNLLDLIAEPYS